MKSQFKLFVICTLLLALSGCAYRYYLGLHGPSIKLYPDEHEEEVTADHNCLECHHPDKDPVGPSTSHPNFFGCLKCHNDEVVAWNKSEDYISLNQSTHSLWGQARSEQNELFTRSSALPFLYKRAAMRHSLNQLL